MERFAGPETRALIENERTPLTLHEAQGLARSLAQTARAYGRATEKLRVAKARVKVQESIVRELRRQLRLLTSGR